jgi:hypothetical protein
MTLTEESVKIICLTTEAATQVLTILSAAGLHLRQDYMIGPILAAEPPLVFTLVRPLTGAFLEQIRAVPDVATDS